MPRDRHCSMAAPVGAWLPVFSPNVVRPLSWTYWGELAQVCAETELARSNEVRGMQHVRPLRVEDPLPRSGPVV